MSSHTKSLPLPYQRRKTMNSLYGTNKETESMKNLPTQMLPAARGPPTHMCIRKRPKQYYI